MPSCSSMRRSRCSRSSRLRRASRRAASAALPGGSGGGCDGPRRRLQALAFADAGAGRAGLAEGRGSAHGTIIARTGVLRATPVASRARFSASAAPCPAAPAAEDGVGDLHPLGIGIVAVGQDHQAQVAARDERQAPKPLVEPVLFSRRWSSSACGAGSLAILWVAAPSASSCRPAGASGRSASRRLPSPGPGSCRRPCSNRDEWHRAPAPRACPGAPDAGWHRRSAAGRPRWFTP